MLEDDPSDTVITGGVVPDFKTGKLMPASVIISNGKIAAVVPEPDTLATEQLFRNAAEVIDAAGHVVSPGFIDPLIHEENLFETGEYVIGRYMARMGVTTCLCGNCGESPQPVKKLAAWIASKGGAPTNYLVLAGYNTYRRAQRLHAHDQASEVQQRAVRRIIQHEIQDGCAGVSFGLEHDPGISTDEMTAAVRAVADLDPFVSVHFRADGEGALASLKEMAQLSRDTGVPVEVSHLSSLAGYGHMSGALDFIHREMEENPLFGFDTVPYTTFCTELDSAVFDADWQTKWGCGYEAIQFLRPPYKGWRARQKTFEEMREKDPHQPVACFALKPKEIEAAVADPLGLICSDGGVRGGRCHPRTTGAFPRVFSRYVRGTGSLSLMEALEKMTIRAARRIGIDGFKGSIEPGKDADIVIFDPDAIADQSTYEEPELPPVGIDRVMVSGVTVVRDDHDTRDLPGRLIRRDGTQVEPR